MIQAAIVGMGRWGRLLVEATEGRNSGLRFTTGADTDPSRVADFAAKHQLKLTQSYEAVLADPAIQAVVLATPHSAHKDQVVSAAAAGKHVFCEKPLALTWHEASEMIDACKRAGVVLAVGHNRRLWPSMLELKRWIASGDLGEFLHIEGNYSNENSSQFPGTWRDSVEESPGGGITGAGLHVLDAFTNLVGPLKSVRSQLIVRKPPPAPLDVASCMIEFANGVSGALSTVRATPHFWRVHAFGTKASVESVGENEVVIRRSGGATERQTFTGANSLRVQLDAFADSVATGKPFLVTETHLQNTIRAFEAVLAAQGSGQTISL